MVRKLGMAPCYFATRGIGSVTELLNNRINDGSRKILASRSVHMMKAVKTPNCATGTKLEKPKTRKPKVRAMEAANIAAPAFLRLSLEDSGTESPLREFL